ncbi:MAG: hypothetical protein ACKOXZ_05770, partial [Polynucleobacter victoriensis]
GLWLGDVEYLKNDPETIIEAEHQKLADDVGKIIASLQKKGVREDQMPFARPYELDQCGWVANRWCEILPLTPAQKHHLLGHIRFATCLTQAALDESDGAGTFSTDRGDTLSAPFFVCSTGPLN